jgi:hypothetical protein
MCSSIDYSTSLGEEKGQLELQQYNIDQATVEQIYGIVES